MGNVEMADSQGPCRSCRGVIAGFKKEFANVAIKISYQARDKLRPTVPGPGGGVYGYDDAGLEDGSWVKRL